MARKVSNAEPVDRTTGDLSAGPKSSEDTLRIFEGLWDILPENLIAVSYQGRSGCTEVLFKMQLGKWQIISGLCVGVRGGVTEILWACNNDEPQRDLQLRIDGRPSDATLKGTLYRLHRVRAATKTARSDLHDGGIWREAVLSECKKFVQDMLTEMRQAPGEFVARIEHEAQVDV